MYSSPVFIFGLFCPCSFQLFNLFFLKSGISNIRLRFLGLYWSVLFFSSPFVKFFVFWQSLIFIMSYVLVMCTRKGPGLRHAFAENSPDLFRCFLGHFAQLRVALAEARSLLFKIIHFSQGFCCRPLIQWPGWTDLHPAL